MSGPSDRSIDRFHTHNFDHTAQPKTYESLLSKSRLFLVPDGRDDKVRYKPFENGVIA
jgi:hypothetical protein